MTTAPTRRHGRAGWLAAAAASVALVGALVQQLAPTAASADAPHGLAAAAQAPAVAEPSPESAPAAPEVPSAPATPSGAIPAAPPVTAPAAPAAPAADAASAPQASPKTAPRRTAAGDVCSGPGWQAKRGARALASLRHTTPAGVTVAFKGSRAGYLGLTYPQRAHVDMFVRSCSAESWALLRHVMAHEMGHAYDAAHMTAASRAAYMAARGIPAGTPWFGCSYCSDFATPAGDFAETYSQWQRGTADSRTRIAPMPGPAALARLGQAFFSR